MNRLLNIYNRIKNFDPRKLTPIQMVVAAAAFIVGLWVVWMIIQLFLQLLPIALAVLGIYLAYRWLSSRSEEIPAELTKSKNQRIVDEALANVKNAATGIFGASEEDKAKVTSEATTADVLSESALENLSVEEPIYEEVDDDNLAVKQIVNPETGFKEPDISRLIEREEEKLREMDKVNDDIMAQIEARRKRLKGGE